MAARSTSGRFRASLRRGIAASAWPVPISSRLLGQTVTVEGIRARNGSLSAYMRKIVLPDGTSLELVSGSGTQIAK